METTAVVLQKPGHLSLAALPLTAPSAEDVMVDIKWSGISTGTERLLWSGRMPDFPGMGYPLVPGYESVGQVAEAGPKSGRRAGDTVFVPGAQCYGAVRGLFGGASSRVVTPGQRTVAVDPALAEDGVLLALAATARHAIAGGDRPPDLIVGHGVLGRLLARLTLALGGAAPTVWETEPKRLAGGLGYPVCLPEQDERRDYTSVYDASGNAALIDDLIQRLALGGEIVLAGFYEQRPSFDFPPAFMREARLRVAAEWRPEDMTAVRGLVDDGRLSLAGLVTHRETFENAAEAYPVAFGEPDCLKMILDWRGAA